MKNVTQETKNTSMEGLLQQAFCVCEECLDTLKAELQIPEAEYFLDVIRTYYEPNEPESKVIIFGTDFPDEIVYALTGAPPYHVIGGSHVLADASDEYVPRDTDPVTRAILGQLFALEDKIRQSAIVAVPCASDAQRKAANLLQDRGWNVVTVWMPSVNSEASHSVYLSELEHAIRSLCRHLGRRYSAAALKRSIKLYDTVRQSISMFLEKAEKLPGPMRMAIIESCYMTPNLDEWHEKLDILTNVLTDGSREEGTKPRILLVGSPVYIPNYKIPFLLFNSGLDICASVDSNTALISSKISDKGTLEALAAHYFNHSASAAFVNNVVLHDTIMSQAERSAPDGIVWHVLKGQIEYDFELVRNEKYFEELELPVIRLETDYQYQDIEQLRIRIEAFAELLTQKKLEKRRLT